MINLINTYVEMQKKLKEEFGIIGVTTNRSMPEVQVYELDDFMGLAEDQEIRVVQREGIDGFYHVAIFEENNITFLIVLDDKEYNEIITFEGVKHE